MAPDLNSVPPSPRPRDQTTAPATQTLSPPSSRHTSASMAPPPVPQTPGSPNSLRVSNTQGDNTGVGAGPGQDSEVNGAALRSNTVIGPLRHPRPMTASEIYLECEKEQEGIVNRLTRELSLLRQQTASVASTTSSTSELVSDYSNIVPTSARRHRSSSNLSARSTRSINAANANVTSVSAVAPARETSVASSSRPSMDNTRPDLSRQDSATGRRSVTSSPSLSTSHVAYGAPFGQVQSHQTQPHRYSSSSQSATLAAAVDSSAHHTRSPSFSAAVAAARYEEAAFHRSELEAVKRENEALRQRIRELERSLGGRSTAGENASRSRTASAVDE